MASVVRHGIRVRGTVQGVGFRPTVYRLAREAQLGGLVRNDEGGVWIEIEGAPEAVEAFPRRLREGAPPLAKIEGLEVRLLEPRGEAAFVIEGTRAGDAQVCATIPADVATCEACLGEMLDAADRRHHYPFINCTNCGPRYTIVRELPYDRAGTTMARFAMCARCRAEYEDPASRRFHAEPNACPECGPRLELVGQGERLLRAEALEAAIEALAAGRIVAVKGLGGFQLAVDARNEVAVARLRERKRRPHKPFAVMARDLHAASRVGRLEGIARELLRAPERPIVLLPKLDGELAPSVAPNLDEVGVMLPYTPLHHLLLRGPMPVLVMTSGNRVDEPIAKDDARALEQLAGIADVFLLHDREIHARVDDSVVRIVAGDAQPVRRARGFVPLPIALEVDAPPVLAVGAQLKNTICVTRGSEAFLSTHIGDVESVDTYGFFRETITKHAQLLGVEPRAVAHDLHPDYLTTRWALGSGLPRVAVQHHHAHIAACMAEHGRVAPVIGVAFDGTGCGPDGDLWGGEVLIADYASARRFAHLRPVALPGGEAAIRAPWRIACAALLDAGVDPRSVLDLDEARVAPIRELVERGLNAPRATGAGRWFDAVAAICGVRHEVSYEGQAAIELEAVADGRSIEPFPFEFASSHPREIDLRPMVRALASAKRAGEAVAALSSRFHETLARAAVQAALHAREEHRIETVALSGGCFQNRRLTERCIELFGACGFEVLVHRRVPPNDGGIALGQAAVAAFRLHRKEQADVPGHTR